jgi:hypothetical protein
MFSVTPVPENRDRKVSFSPDIDESYRHHVVDKIQGLVKEVEVIHEKEEKQLSKFQENQFLDFKQKQDMELKAFMKRQQDEASGFQANMANNWNDLKERHTQETWKLFGRASTRPDMSRPTIHNMWGEQEKKQDDSRHSSPCFSPKPASETSNHSWSSMNTSTLTSPTSWPTQSPWDRSPGGRHQQAHEGAANNRALNYWN